jgi:hypothetical protein
MIVVVVVVVVIVAVQDNTVCNYVLCYVQCPAILQSVQIVNIEVCTIAENPLGSCESSITGLGIKFEPTAFSAWFSFDYQQGQNIFFLCNTLKLAVGPTHSPQVFSPVVEPL